MARFGAALPLHNLSPAHQLAYIRQVETSGYDSVWIPEVMGTDAFTVLAAASQVTQRLRLGTGIVPIYTRTPTTLAMTIATLDALSGGRAVLGLGVSSEIIIGAWHGLPFPKPLGAMREAIEIIRRLLRNERVTVEGSTFQVRNLRANVPVPPERTIPIYIGALNSGMLRLAGELADGVFSTGCQRRTCPAPWTPLLPARSVPDGRSRILTLLASYGSVSPIIQKPPVSGCGEN